jgi:iron complex transport system substrate-binding protein
VITGKKLTLFLTALALLALVLAGCNNAGTTSPATTATTAAPTAGQTTAPASTTPAATTEAPAPTSFTVTDMMGREVVIPAEIETIATFGAIGVINTFVETMAAGTRSSTRCPPTLPRPTSGKCSMSSPRR